MTKDQKVTGAWIATLLLALALGLSLWLALLGTGKNPKFAVNPEDLGDPELLFPWKVVKLVIELGTESQWMLGGLVIVVTVAIGWMMEAFSRRWQLYAIVAACVIGILATFWLMSGMNGPNDPKILELCYYSRICDVPDQAKTEALARTDSGLRAFCLGLIALFSSFLAARLGIELVDDEGKLRKLLKRLLGEGGAA